MNGFKKISLISRVFLAVLTLFGFAIVGDAGDSLGWQLEFVRDSQKQMLSTAQAETYKADILATLKATGTESSGNAGSKKKWDAWTNGTYFLLSFGEPTEVIGLGTKTIKATDVLIPISHEGHYLVRHRRGRFTQYWAFTKYMPEPRAQLLCRPELDLAEYEPYCEFLERKGNPRGSPEN